MRVAVDASQLTKVITLTAPQMVADGQGGYTEQLVPLSPPIDYAAIEPATGDSGELPMAGTVLAALSHRVGLRWRSDVDLHTQITFVDWARRTRRLWVRNLQNPAEQAEMLV